MSLICIEGQCTKGGTAVAALASFYNSAGQPQEFSSAVSAIQSRYDALNSSWSRQLPFASACCEIEQIGNEADTLRAQIASAYGQADIPADTRQSPIDTGIDTATSLLNWGLVLVGAYIAFQIYEVSK